MSPYRDPDHELWPGLLDGIPEVLRPQVEEPAFCDETGQLLATAVLWRLIGDDRWHSGEDITLSSRSPTCGKTSPRLATRSPRGDGTPRRGRTSLPGQPHDQQGGA